MGYCRRMSVTCFLQDSKGWDITLGYVEEESQYWISHIQWNALIHDKYLAYRHATNVTVYSHYFQEGDSYTLPVLIFSYSLPEPFLTLQLNLTTSHYLFFFSPATLGICLCGSLCLETLPCLWKFWENASRWIPNVIPSTEPLIELFNPSCFLKTV